MTTSVQTTPVGRELMRLGVELVAAVLAITVLLPGLLALAATAAR